MSNKIIFLIEESNLKFKLYYTKTSIDKCFRKVSDLILDDFQKSNKQRYVVAVAGPPGCGKSSIAHLLSSLLKKNSKIETIVLPLDGFHYTNDYLKSTRYRDSSNHTLYDVKGAPESYDTGSYKDKLGKLVKGNEFYWPIYSRKTHNPVEKGIKILKQNAVYIIEGNYLLLDETPWRDFTHNYNIRIYINSKEKFLRKRIIKRKIAGGYNRMESKKHYMVSDRENIKRVLNDSRHYNILITQKRKYHYTFESIIDT